MTMVDFMVTIKFYEMPLSIGKAACVINTTTGEDLASLTCSVDEQEVCTAIFKIMAYK